MTRKCTVVRTGPQALVQDLGRPGHAHLGVPPSGALDRPALMLANRLVGNAESAAGIEVLLGDLWLRAECSCTVAVAGPAVSVAVGERPADSHTPVHLNTGDVLRLGRMHVGLRCYVAISGGIEVPEEMGSRSTDLLSGIGPDPLCANDMLPLGESPGIAFGVDVLSPSVVTSELLVPVLSGPRDDWFGAGGMVALRSTKWVVSEQSNRVGLRLEGDPLQRDPVFDGVELASEGVITGAIQVPPSGRPVLFLADHPVTGGYPVIGVVPSSALPGLAQARPGTTLRFAQYSDS